MKTHLEKEDLNFFTQVNPKMFDFFNFSVIHKREIIEIVEHIYCNIYVEVSLVMKEHILTKDHLIKPKKDSGKNHQFCHLFEFYVN